AYLCASDITVNSLVKSAAQSIVTKIGDYLASGNPMINTGSSPEFRAKVTADGFGANVEAEDAQALADAIAKLAGHASLRKIMGSKARAVEGVRPTPRVPRDRFAAHVAVISVERLAKAGQRVKIGHTPIACDHAGRTPFWVRAIVTEQKRISFSPPDITQAELDEVADALRSGWITTGPKTKEFEREIALFAQAERSATFASATAALECALRAFGIGPGDEVITSAYTYTASCSVICHVGATPVLCDVASGSYEMDYDALPDLVTERTRAVIPVDIAGRMVDYDRLFAALDSTSDRWKPATELQSAFDRVIVLADAAHSFGATYQGRPSGSVADFTAFSFHAVKNLTTAEGGALAWRAGAFDSDELYRRFMLQSLHGQTKDALAKNRAGAWEYDIAFPGWKCNMTDIQAALGLAQLRRYPASLARRRAIVERYERNLGECDVELLRHYGEDFESSGHLMLVRLTGKSSAFRNALIERMADDGVATNVHYKPLPLLTAYRDLGFAIADFPNALAQFENEVTLPLHTLLSDEDVDYVAGSFKRALDGLEAEGVR
ncbi:MAG: aminotransferase class I/II-fold pyridoxal phosphate-dependent enzyme, partial [Eggerthella lenta]